MINLCDWFEIKFEKKMLLNTRNESYMKLIVKQKLSNISTVDKEIVLNWSKILINLTYELLSLFFLTILNTTIIKHFFKEVF